MRDGRSLFVRVLGRGTPVMVVHGFAADGGSWLPFIAPFLHRHRFIVPDLRGFGRSHELPFPNACALTQFAEDLGDTLRALQVERAALIGISMGALSSVQAFELGEASRIARYLHIDQGPVIHNGPRYAHGLLGELQAQFFVDTRSLLEQLEREHFDKRWHAVPRPLRAEFWRLMGVFAAAAFTSKTAQRALAWASRNERLMERALPTSNWQVYTRVVRAYLDRAYDLRESFRKINVPLTVLIGGGSRMYAPAGQRAIRDYAPHAELREIPRAGHMIPYEAPRAFVRELDAFLRT
jgi:pimeloyl-ACP methyl ester carboxylesterase